MFVRFRARLQNMLRIDASPKKIAMSFAVGVFIGFSPFFGLHTLLGLLAAYIFHLSRAATVTGVFITNPISLVPIYTFCIWLGMVILGVDMSDVILNIDWKSMTLFTMSVELEALLLPFFVGTFVAGIIGAVVSYHGVRIYVQHERWEEDTWLSSSGEPEADKGEDS